MKEGLFIPMTHSELYYSDMQVTAMKSYHLRLIVANEILNREFLLECEYLHFSEVPYYFAYVDDTDREEIGKHMYYEGIDSILALKSKRN